MTDIPTLKHALETNDPSLPTLLSSPTHQHESITLLHSNHTLAYVFLKNMLSLSLNHRITLPVTYMNEVYAVFLDRMYVCDDFCFRVTCEMVEVASVHVQMDMARVNTKEVIDAIKVVCHGSNQSMTINQSNQPNSQSKQSIQSQSGNQSVQSQSVQQSIQPSSQSGQSKQSVHTVVRYLSILKHALVHLERCPRNDKTLSEVDYYVRHTHTILLPLLRTTLHSRSAYHSILIDVIHSLIYQDMHFLLEEDGLPRIIEHMPDSRLVRLCMCKYTELMDMKRVLVHAVHLRDHALVSTVVDRCYDGNVHASDILARMGMDIDHMDMDSVSSTADVMAVALRMLIRDMHMPDSERMAIRARPYTYISTIVHTDAYRGHVHGLVRSVVRAETSGVLQAIDDEECRYFVCSVTRLPTYLNNMHRDTVSNTVSNVSNNISNVDRNRDNNVNVSDNVNVSNNVSDNVSNKDMNAITDGDACMFTYCRMMIACGVRGMPCTGTDTACALAYTCMVGMRYDRLVVDEHRTVMTDYDRTGGDVCTYNLTCNEHVVRAVRASVWHRVKGGCATAGMRTAVQAIHETVMRTYREVGNVRVYGWLVDVLMLCGTDMHVLVEGVISGGIDELVEMVVYIMAVDVYRGNGTYGSMLANVVGSAGLSDGVRQLALLAMGRPCEYRERMLFIRNVPYVYAVRDGTVHIDRPFKACISDKLLVMLFLCNVGCDRDVLLCAAQDALRAGIRCGYEREVHRAVRMISDIDKCTGDRLRECVGRVCYGMDIDDEWPLFVLDAFGMDCYY